MGNAVWGNGYHAGFSEGVTKGFSDGTKQGGLITGATSLAILGIAAGGKLVYDKIKARRLSQLEAAAVAPNDLALDEVSASDTLDESGGPVPSPSA